VSGFLCVVWPSPIRSPQHTSLKNQKQRLSWPLLDSPQPALRASATNLLLFYTLVTSKIVPGLHNCLSIQQVLFENGKYHRRDLHVVENSFSDERFLVNVPCVG
jgi:hypothetical protein